MGNALKFTFNGSITVKISFEKITSTLISEIEDTGIGIKDNDL